MRLLLDGHALLWWHDGTLSERTRAWIEDPESAVFVSVATPWELGLKMAKGKLRVDAPLGDIVRASEFDPLPITWAHVDAAVGLPDHHADPFDRMLVAQAQVEGLSIVTDDERLSRYAVHTVPARRAAQAG